MGNKTFVLQSQIERKTGFGIDQLRKWRQRYGFPPAETGVDGRAIYSKETITKLALIKRLMEGGFPPRQIVAKSVTELNLMLDDVRNTPSVVNRSELAVTLIELLSHSEIEEFGRLLLEDRRSKTILEFCQNTLGPLTISIGDAWAKNEIDIYHEHLYTTHVKRLLISETLKFIPIEGYPTFLFALPPNENHQLGLLMAEAVIAEYGGRVVNIGADVPLNSIKLAALSVKADVVAVSFSFAYPVREILPVLRHLRHLLPTHIELWAGGSSLAFLKKSPKGVLVIRDLGAAVLKAGEILPR